MPILAFGVIWGGYTIFLLGWATIKGYVKEDNSRVSLGDLVKVSGGGYTGPWGNTVPGIPTESDLGGGQIPLPTPDKKCPPGYLYQELNGVGHCLKIKRA